MSAIETEIARLSNKDVKIRRRAVRHLFDADNPRALKGFVPLLVDDDFWFKNKALDAHRKWANSSQDLMPLMDGHQRLVGELLERIEAPELAQILFESDDHITRSFAARSLSNDAEMHERFASDIHHSVRMVAASSSTDEQIISALISDKHSSVRRAAIANASENEIVLSQDILESGLTSSDANLRSLIASMAVKVGGDILEKACKDSNPKVRKSIADTLRNEIQEVDDRIQLIAKTSPEIIVRWLRSRYDENSIELRWGMIEDESINSRLRLKLIEQMEGRLDIDLERLNAISNDESKLVQLAAMNLSASVAELEGERQ